MPNEVVASSKAESLEDQMSAIDRAFYAQYPLQPQATPVLAEEMYVMETYADYLIVSSVARYFKVPFTSDGDVITFASRDQWTEVEEKSEWVDKVKAIKVGARNSTADMGRIQAAHDTLVELGAQCQQKPEVETIPMRAADIDDASVYYGSEVKAMGDGKIGGYLVRFSTDADPDLTGDFFTADTDFGEAEKTPVLYHHGMDTKVGKRKIGTGTLKKDEVGIWIEAQLSMRDAYEKAIYEMAEANKAGWSSGTATHLVDREPAGKAYKITRWPLGLDASITPTPAEPRNSVIPLKSLSSELLPNLQEPEGQAQATGDVAPGDGNSSAGQPTKTATASAAATKSFEGVTMELTEEMKEIIKAVSAESAKAGAEEAIKALPNNGNGGFLGGVQVVKDEADQPFKSLAEQCSAVRKHDMSKGRQTDPRLTRLDPVKALGANEATPDDGGFLLDATVAPELLKPMHETGPFSQGVRKLPVGSNSNYGKIHGVDESSRATGSRWGGIRGYRLAEGGTMTASRPKFRDIDWKLKKYGVLCYATDELLADAMQFSAVVNQGCAEELSFMANDDIMNGLGTAGPLGILVAGDPAATVCIQVAAETGQAAATINNENLLNMWARLSPSAKRSAVWYINTDCYPQLHALSISAGTAALEPRFVTYAADGTLRIFGKPVMETEFNATLGTVGDIVVGDMGEYLFWEKGGVQAASSIHVAFLTDESVFRFIYRCDGQPSISKPLTPYKGTATVSPFVALATRS